jgi:hypothetical protein
VTEQQVLYDEEVIVRPTCSTGETETLQPHGGVGVPRILDNVRRRVKACREWHLSDSLCEHLRSAGVWAWVALSVPHPRVQAMVIRVTVTIM